MEEPGKIKHQKRGLEPVPEDVTQKGPEAVAAWRQAQAVAWQTEHDLRITKLREDAMARAIQERAFLMKMVPDLRLYTCRMLDPVIMFMIYDADQLGGNNSFHNWCNTLKTNAYGIKECIWDHLLHHHYGNVADLNTNEMNADQRRWKFYAYWMTDEQKVGSSPNLFFVNTDFPLNSSEYAQAYTLSFTLRGRFANTMRYLTHIGSEGPARSSNFFRGLRAQDITTNSAEDGSREDMISLRPGEDLRRQRVNIIMIMFSCPGIAFRLTWPLNAIEGVDDTQLVYIHATCIECNANATAFVCGGCEEVGYCGKACATKDWHQNGHKDSCGAK